MLDPWKPSQNAFDWLGERRTERAIVLASESMYREDSKRPPHEQIGAQIGAGVIDEEGRVQIGTWNKNKPDTQGVQRNGLIEGATPQTGSEAPRPPE